MSTTAAAVGGPLQQQITQKLQATFAPVHLDVINESSGHNVPAGSESHFKVVVVSEQFDGVALLQRHRLVNAALSAELDGSHGLAGLPAVHALSVKAKTPKQWEKSGGAVGKSPPCLGGDGSLPPKRG